MPKFNVNEGLSEVDKQFLFQEEEKPKQDNSPGALDDFNILFKQITWKNSREWKCPFCLSENSVSDRRCEKCASHRYQYGNIDLSYKTPDKRKINKLAEERMKGEYIKKYGNPNL